MRIPMLTDKGGLPLGLEETVTREQFENLIEEYVKRTHEPIRTALEDGGVSAGELSMVLLVGGSTRVPLVVRDLAGFLEQEPKQEINPDFSVAEGAAIQAGIISGAVAEEDQPCHDGCKPIYAGSQMSDGVFP